MIKVHCDICGKETKNPAPEGFTFIWEKTLSQKEPNERIVMRISTAFRDNPYGSTPDLCIECFNEGVERSLKFWQENKLKET